MRRVSLGSVICLSMFCLASTVAAQATGWSHARAFTAENATTGDLTGYPIAIALDTAALVTAGEMKTGGEDIRVSAGCTADNFLPVWVEAPNTATTRVWVRTDIPRPGIALYLMYGNSSATTVSNLNAVFDGDSQAGGAPFSSTNQVAVTTDSSAGTCQRGFRFSPKDYVVLVQFGKREPTGSTRYITLFDFTSQMKLLQVQVPGPAAQYSYIDVAPFVLTPNKEYVLQMYQGTSDHYYYGSSSGIASQLNYLDMRYCNACDQNTFPTSALSNFHYGTPDFRFLARPAVSPVPTLMPGAQPSTTCNADGSAARCGDSTVNSAAGEECDDGNNVNTDDCLNNCKNGRCGDGATKANVEECDDGNQVDTDACRNDCTDATCGDGVVQAGVEECDDGNQVDTDACRNNCDDASCGDGVVQAGSEDCDDDNTEDGDGCSATCQTEPGAADSGTPPGGAVDAGDDPDPGAPSPDAGGTSAGPDAGEPGAGPDAGEPGSGGTMDASAPVPDGSVTDPTLPAPDAGKPKKFVDDGCHVSAGAPSASETTSAGWYLLLLAALWTRRKPRRRS
jgi:MYXO-CTERM domain-containing protein